VHYPHLNMDVNIVVALLVVLHYCATIESKNHQDQLNMTEFDQLAPENHYLWELIANKTDGMVPGCVWRPAAKARCD